MRPLLVLVGPSGSGKSTLARGLAAAGLVEVHRTWTTRRPRADEDPRTSDHVFVNADRFASAAASGHLVVTVDLFGHRYGLPRLPTTGASPSQDRPLLLVGRGPLLPLLGPLHPSPLVYALAADGPALSGRVADRSLDPEEREARDVFACAEHPDAAHRAFDSTALTPAELLTAVSEQLQTDLARHAAAPLVEVVRD